jgi:hypothetical protein
MGNNPVGMVDPDGGYSWLVAWAMSGFNSGNMRQRGDGEWGVYTGQTQFRYFESEYNVTATGVRADYDFGSRSGGGGAFRVNASIEPGLPSTINFNDKYASVVEKLAGKSYSLGANGPKAFDCSSTACYGIRKAANSKFGDYTANDLFKKFSISSSSKLRGSVMFYDYTSDGNIDHVTTILDPSNMLHPSSSALLLQVKPINYLDSYTKNKGGTIYLREFNWELINEIP